MRRNDSGPQVDVFRLQNGSIPSDARPDEMAVLTVTDDGTAVLMMIEQNVGPIGIISVRSDRQYVLSLHTATGSTAYGLISSGHCTGAW